MNATETVEAYYEALRRGEPLPPYFAEREDVVKFGVSERLAGYEAVAEGLREQTRTTEDWQVESRDLRVTARESVAWFTDDVGLSWTDTADASDAAETPVGAESSDAEGTRHSFDTRWSGVLERVDGGDETDVDGGDRTDPDGGDGADTERDGTGWRFTQIHVSASRTF